MGQYRSVLIIKEPPKSTTEGLAMKKISPLFALASILLCVLSGCSTPQHKVTPIQLGLYHPVQMFGENYDVDGMRLNLLWTRNQNINGGDFGLGFNECLGKINGLQMAGASVARKGVNGVQLGLLSECGEKLHGVQVGLGAARSSGGAGIRAGGSVLGDSFSGLQLAILLDWTFGSVNGVQGSLFLSRVEDDMNGLEIGGFLNSCGGHVRGVQIGLMNYSRSLSGVQIGLWNSSDDGGFRFCPIINCGFFSPAKHIEEPKAKAPSPKPSPLQP